MIKAIVFDLFGVLLVNDQPNEPLMSHIKWVLKPNYKIGIISNSTGQGLRAFSEKELGLFDGAVFSGRYGKAKPDPGIYKAALDDLGVEAGEAIYVDDNQHFCLAAEQVGMRSIWYQEFDQIKLDLEKILHDNI